MITPLIRTTTGYFERIPYAVVGLAARAALATVFLRSGLVKIDDWASTQYLFESEYALPLLPAGVWAILATALELGGGAALVAGLLTRYAALAFLGMTIVIQLLIYPDAWPVHLQWAALLLLLLSRGAGAISLDALAARWAARR